MHGHACRRPGTHGHLPFPAFRAARGTPVPTVREATKMSTSFRKIRRFRKFRRAAAVLAAGSLLLLGQQALTAPAAEAAATFTDDFNGSAGSAVDGSKWQLETGDNVNNHERQYYTSGTNNAQLDGQGHLVITA